MEESNLITKLNELRSLPAETETVEFKKAETTFSFDELGKYFSALSNEANLKGKESGWLVFGIENEHHKIVGTQYKRERKEIDKLKKGIADKTTDRTTFIEIYELKLSEGRVLMFQIPPAPRGIPVAWEGHYYARDNESLIPLNIEKRRRIEAQIDED